MKLGSDIRSLLQRGHLLGLRALSRLVKTYPQSRQTGGFMAMKALLFVALLIVLAAWFMSSSSLFASELLRESIWRRSWRVNSTPGLLRKISTNFSRAVFSLLVTDHRSELNAILYYPFLSLLSVPPEDGLYPHPLVYLIRLDVSYLRGNECSIV